MVSGRMWQPADFPRTHNLFASTFIICYNGMGPWRGANQGGGVKAASWMRGVMTFILPLMAAVILVLGLK